MARQTRAQRRERRAQLTGNGVAGAAEDGRVRAVAPREVEETPRPSSERLALPARIHRFVSESSAELKKVEWPTQPQLVTGTTVVLIACAIVGLYLYAADRVFSPLVNWLIGH